MGSRADPQLEWRNTVNKTWKVSEIHLISQVSIISELSVRNNWRWACLQGNSALHSAACFSTWLSPACFPEDGWVSGYQTTKNFVTGLSTVCKWNRGLTERRDDWDMMGSTLDWHGVILTFLGNRKRRPGFIISETCSWEGWMRILASQHFNKKELYSFWN